jgi:hypothetical protein
MLGTHAIMPWVFTWFINNLKTIIGEILKTSLKSLYALPMKVAEKPTPAPPRRGIDLQMINIIQYNHSLDHKNSLRFLESAG